MSRKSAPNRLTPDADIARWCAALVPESVDKVPAGWMTVNNLADKLGKSRNTVSGQVSAAVREGRAEVQKFRVMTNRGAYPVPHYKLK